MKFHLSIPILSYRINIYKPQESNINTGRQLHFNRVPEFIAQMFVMKQMKVTCFKILLMFFSVLKIPFNSKVNCFFLSVKLSSLMSSELLMVPLRACSSQGSCFGISLAWKLLWLCSTLPTLYSSLTEEAEVTVYTGGQRCNSIYNEISFSEPWNSETTQKRQNKALMDSLWHISSIFQLLFFLQGCCSNFSTASPSLQSKTG